MYICSHNVARVHILHEPAIGVYNLSSVHKFCRSSGSDLDMKGTGRKGKQKDTGPSDETWNPVPCQVPNDPSMCISTDRHRNGERQSFEETKNHTKTKQTNKKKPKNKTNKQPPPPKQNKQNKAPLQSSSGTIKTLTTQGWVYNNEYYK